MGAYYFLACLLPPLPSSLGEKLTVPFPDITRMVRRHIQPSDDDLLRAQLSIIDAANWESIDQGRDHFQEGGTLTYEEMETRQNLPAFIRQFLAEKERGIRRPHIYDRLWELCYGALLAQAQEEGCRFLIDYTVWEIELRNCLATLRLRESEGNITDHTIMPGIRTFDFSALLSQLDGQKNPLEAERIIEGERLKQIFHCQGADPFSLDAILAFLARAFIYSRWERMQIPYDIHNFIYSGG
ncbi:MAG: hypothetical protein FD159_2 [Syntrophaceae bacterium]|nr:MAG: hypothetical protein FD159_2 [Syntrophaceae bacterium]